MGGPAVCDPSSTSSPSNTGAPVSGGLKAAWGLNDPPSLDDGGTCEQAKKFTADFKAAMDPVNKCLQYTKCNAEKTKHEEMVAKRDYQYNSFQSVRSQIDPAKEDAAKDPISKLLASSKGVADEANKLAAATEKSVAAWDAKSKDFDNAVHQIEELEGFEFKDAKVHRDAATEIQKTVNENKFDEAVAKFGQLDTNLKPAYADYQKQKEAKEYREKKWNEVKPRIDTLVADKPPIGAACEELESATKVMDQAVEQKDWLAAKDRVDELSTRLEQHEKAYEKRKEDKKFYDEKWPALKTDIDKLSSASEVEETKAAVADIGKDQTEMTGFATAGEYDKARPILEKLTESVDKLKQSLHDLYEKSWADVKCQLPTTSQPGSPKETELLQQLNELTTKVESAASSGDYVAALKQIPDAKAKLKEVTDEHAAYEKRKAEFETRSAGMKEPVEVAVGTPTEVKELKATQDAVKTKKAEVDAAATAGDYEAGLKKLDELDAALKAHQEELRKSPQDCDWVRDTCIGLTARINRLYMGANTKISRAAQAYDDALKEHTGALKKVTAAKELAANVAIGIFFAGLGGAAGGAVGVLAKKPIEAAFEGAAARGALIDASKDVAKWVTRTYEKFGGKSSDPLPKLSAFGGSGTELARKVGQAVNTQAEGLFKGVEQLVDLVRGNPVCKDGGSVRVEGDPYAALESDAFLKTLGTIADVDKKTFAQLLWAQWISAYAYDASVICKNETCKHYVDSNVDGIFAWWGDLRQNMVAQTGDDFGLQPRLDAARAEMQKRVDEMNKIERH